MLGLTFSLRVEEVVPQDSSRVFVGTEALLRPVITHGSSFCCFCVVRIALLESSYQATFAFISSGKMSFHLLDLCSNLAKPCLNGSRALVAHANGRLATFSCFG